MSSPAHILALPPGYVLESYRIERVLGEGGFGITYLAVDAGSGKRVAIKELLPGDIATRIQGSTVVPKGEHLAEAWRWAVEAFTNEAKALAQLSHPNVVPIHRLFQANGTAYMVMDYVEGDSLRIWLEKHPRPSEDDLRGLLLPLLDGLEYVHKRGLLHRDIKPDNIFLTEEGRPVLLDFGSARVDTGRTQTMTAVVSEGYSPFEQYQRKVRQTAATDLYSLAAVMVRAITGETPATAIDRSEDDPIEKTVSRTHAGRYSAAFLNAVDAAFAVKAKDRPQSVSEWRALLAGHAASMERGLQSASSSKSTPSQGRTLPGSGLLRSREANSALHASPARPWLPWVAAALVSVGVGAAVFVLLGGGSAGPDHGSAVVSVTTTERLPKVTPTPSPAPAPVTVVVPPQPSPTPPAPKPMPVVIVPVMPPQPPPAGSTPSSATKASPFVNTLGMKFVPVPGTQVLFCQHETRKGDYAAYARSASGVDDSWKNVEYKGVPVSAGDDHPVVNVNWEDAVAFCDWLGRKDGRTYRLPTDHEWSCAVGIGDQESASASPESKSMKIEGVYPWGRSFPPRGAVGNYADSTAKAKDTGFGYIDGYTDGYATTAPVMSFEANKHGLYDLGGNVWEWCEDWYNTEKKYRVLRGGSWGINVPSLLLSSYRSDYVAVNRAYDFGFRVVLVVGSGG